MIKELFSVSVHFTAFIQLCLLSRLQIYIELIKCRFWLCRKSDSVLFVFKTKFVSIAV